MTTFTIDPEKMTQVGDNVCADVIDGYLVTVTKMDTTVGPSKSGKSIAIGLTGGLAKLFHVKSPRTKKAVTLNFWLGE